MCSKINWAIASILFGIAIICVIAVFCGYWWQIGSAVVFGFLGAERMAVAREAEEWEDE